MGLPTEVSPMPNPTENQDSVTCLECGHQGSKLYRHVKKHGLTKQGD